MTVNSDAIILTFFSFSLQTRQTYEISILRNPHNANTESANFSNSTLQNNEISPQVLFAGHFKQEKYPELLFNKILQLSLPSKGSQTILEPVGKGVDEISKAYWNSLS